MSTLVCDSQWSAWTSAPAVAQLPCLRSPWSSLYVVIIIIGDMTGLGSVLRAVQRSLNLMGSMMTTLRSVDLTNNLESCH